MMAIQLGKGRSRVRITGAIADGIEDRLRDAMGGVLEVMEAEADVIIGNIKRTWPVSSGRSRDALRHEPHIISTDPLPRGVVIATVD